MGMGNPRHYEVDLQGWGDAAEQGVAKELGHNVHLDIVMSVHGMTEDPQQDRELRGHWGEHCDIMKFVVKRTNFKSHLAHFKRLIFATCKKRTHEGHDKEVRCLVLCRSGRHRSVSFAAFARWCLEYEGFTVDCVHVNCRQWGKLCTTCIGCGKITWIKDKLRKKCIDIWKSLE